MLFQPELADNIFNIAISGGAEKVSNAVARKAYEQFASQFDAKFGGFGGAPKFPRPVTLNFLFDFYGSNPESKEGKSALEMSILTLRKMAEGGTRYRVPRRVPDHTRSAL